MIYYTYCPKTFVYLDSVEADEQPECSSTWAPPEADEYTQAYFNGVSWVRAIALKLLTPKLLRDAAVFELRKEFGATVRRINAGEASEEIDTYPTQAAEARAWAASGALGPFLAALCVARDVEPSDMAQRILDKVEDYNRKLATALGEYRVAVDAIPEDLVLTQSMLRTSVLTR